MGRYLAQAFPTLERRVFSETYDVGPVKKGISTAASLTSYACLAFLFAGDKLLSLLGYAPGEGPAPLLWLRDNRMAAVGVFMGLNVLSTQMVASGAFEVALVSGGQQKLLWSTLASGGRVPSPQMIAQMVAAEGLEPLQQFKAAIAAL